MLLIKIFLCRLWAGYVNLITSESKVVSGNIIYKDRVEREAVERGEQSPSIFERLINVRDAIDAIVCEFTVTRVWFGIWTETLIFSTMITEEGDVCYTIIDREKSSFMITNFMKDSQVIVTTHRHYIDPFYVEITNRYWWHTIISGRNLMRCSAIEKFLIAPIMAAINGNYKNLWVNTDEKDS